MNIIEGIQQECTRLRDEVIPEYEQIPTGIFAIAMMKQSIKMAERAIASGDTIAMIRYYNELKEYEL